MKDTSKEMMRQVTEWKKIFTNHLFDKRLVSRTAIANLWNLTDCWSRIYKELSKLKHKKIGTRFEQTLHQRRNKNGKEAQERCSTSLVIGEMLIKTTMSPASVAPWLSIDI